MAVTKVMFEAVQKVSRANPGVVVDLENSSTYDIILYHRKKSKRWHINRKGEVKRLVVQDSHLHGV